MVDIEKLDNELYKAAYGVPRVGNYNEIWSKIKSDPKVLREAVQVKRDKFDERDLVKGLAIANAMLIDYESIDEVAYRVLINSIYTNTDIARMVVNGASNGGFSFLLMSLWNYDLKLTEEQKTFAVDEAMNKIGTTRWEQRSEKISQKLDDMGISDDNNTLINIDGFITPVGQKTKTEYIDYMLASLDNKQAHGTGEFDIRYHILRNPNWSSDEKQKLIMDFWADAQVYDECLEQWEWGVINDFADFETDSLFVDKAELYQYSYQALLDFYGDINVVDRIWEEIQFCKLMRSLRPQQRELEPTAKKKTLEYPINAQNNFN